MDSERAPSTARAARLIEAVRGARRRRESSIAQAHERYMRDVAQAIARFSAAAAPGARIHSEERPAGSGRPRERNAHDDADDGR